MSKYHDGNLRDTLQDIDARLSAQEKHETHLRLVFVEAECNRLAALLGEAVARLSQHDKDFIQMVLTINRNVVKSLNILDRVSKLEAQIVQNKQVDHTPKTIISTSELGDHLTGADAKRYAAKSQYTLGDPSRDGQCRAVGDGHKPYQPEKREPGWYLFWYDGSPYPWEWDGQRWRSLWGELVSRHAREEFAQRLQEPGK